MRFLCRGAVHPIAFLYLRDQTSTPNIGEANMLDVLFVAAGLAFFAVGLGYTLLCDRL
jgi:hypothetical protein